MNIQTRKLNAIEYLIALQDERALGRIEETISAVRSEDRVNPVPMTKAELLRRAAESEADYLAGRTISQEHLEREHHGDLVALRAAIDEGLRSGVSQRSVTDILNAKVAQLKQDGRL